MFDIAWTEIGLIGIVALIVIGPKDLPVAIKAVSQVVKKARKMAGEFQTHVDEMMRDSNMNDVRDTFNDIRRMDIKGKILSAVDGDGTIRKNIADPGSNFSPAPPVVPVHDSVHERAGHDTAVGVVSGNVGNAPLPEYSIAGSPAPSDMNTGPAPAFVPPHYAPRAEPLVRVPPAFIPPAFASIDHV